MGKQAARNQSARWSRAHLAALADQGRRVGRRQRRRASPDIPPPASPPGSRHLPAWLRMPSPDDGQDETTKDTT